MNTVEVKNPTLKSKAVREAGGFTVIKPGKTAKVEADWSDTELDRYRSAGLQITKAGAAKADPLADLKAQADELGIEYDGRTTQKSLQEAIDAKLAE